MPKITKNYSTKYRTVVHKQLGVTRGQYNQMFIDQAGRCAICKKHQSELWHSLSLDHCHTTQVIRGLLCRNCNAGLGYFRDNIPSLAHVIKYLHTKR